MENGNNAFTCCLAYGCLGLCSMIQFIWSLERRHIREDMAVEQRKEPKRDVNKQGSMLERRERRKFKDGNSGVLLFLLNNRGGREGGKVLLS